jgi:C-methyltransferase
MSGPQLPQGPAAFFQLSGGAQATALLSTAVSLGVFPAIADGATKLDDIAARINAPARSTRILLNGLVAIGLLTKSGQSFALSALADAMLVPGRPGYMGEMLNVSAGEMMWKALGKLKEAVQSGGSVLDEHAETPRHPFWEIFAKSTAGFSAFSATAVEKAVHAFLASKPTARVLDVAAGSGMYGFTIAKNPNVKLTTLDWPNVLVHTKRRAAELGVDAKRVKYIEGDLFEVDWEGPYDVIVMSQIYHHFDGPTCAALTKKVAASLAPGGKVVVQDFLTDDEVRNPAAALFSVTMLVWTRQGEAYTLEDYERWLVDAGLSAPKVVLPEGPPSPSTILVADKA